MTKTMKRTLPSLAAVAAVALLGGNVATASAARHGRPALPGKGALGSRPGKLPPLGTRPSPSGRIPGKPS